jgi:hypothetical protein
MEKETNMPTATNHQRSNALDRAAYMSGRDDARAGLDRFPRCQHPDQYGAYNAGFNDWHKLAKHKRAIDALRYVLPVLRNHVGQEISASELADIENILSDAPTAVQAPANAGA